MALPPLREWQSEALAQWNKVGMRGIVEVATGGGKTMFALAATEKWLEENPRGRVLIIVPTSALQDQWYLALVDTLHIPVAEVATWPGDPSLHSQFHVMIVNTARSKATHVRGDAPLLLIADECHRYASDQNSRALAVEPDATLGLTATAEREYDDGLIDVLVPALGPIFFEYAVSRARREGVLSPFEIINVEVPLTDDEAEKYRSLTTRIQRASRMEDEEKVKRLALQRGALVKGAQMRVPMTIRLMEQYRGVRTLIFHEDIRSADRIASLLSARGHSVAVYHSGLGPALRRDNLRHFRDGLVDILVACRALDEGVDVPEAQVAVIAAASASRRQRIQRLGRVLRTSASKDSAAVLTLFATPAEQERLLHEQSAMADVADVRWLGATIPDA